MAVIRVPRPPRKAFNRKRPISSLLRSQIEHLEWATQTADQKRKPKRRSKSIRTEGEAAAYIDQLTRRLHPAGAATSPAPAAARAPRHAAAGKRKRAAAARASRKRSR